MKNNMHEVGTVEEAVQMLGSEERVVTFINAAVRDRLRRMELNKSYRQRVSEDAKELRTLTQLAKNKGVSLEELIKGL